MFCKCHNMPQPLKKKKKATLLYADITQINEPVSVSAITVTQELTRLIWSRQLSFRICCLFTKNWERNTFIWKILPQCSWELYFGFLSHHCSCCVILPKQITLHIIFTSCWAAAMNYGIHWFPMGNEVRNISTPDISKLKSLVKRKKKVRKEPFARNSWFPPPPFLLWKIE